MVAAHYKKDDLLNCWTSSSDISGYHADFHEGHGTVGAGQGRGMAWARHDMCESALRVFQNRPQDDVRTHYTIRTGNGLTLGLKMEEVTAVRKKTA